MLWPSIGVFKGGGLFWDIFWDIFWGILARIARRYFMGKHLCECWIFEVKNLIKSKGEMLALPNSGSNVGPG